MTGDVHAIGCPVCTRPLPSDTWNLDYETYCRSCRAPITVFAFPALLHRDGGAIPESVIDGQEAGCFYHARKKATVVCDQCGRFLCALCSVELGGQSWCPVCVELHRKQGKLSRLDNRRTLYDNIALVLALGPLVLVFPWVLTIFTAPAALFVVIRYWRAPLSVVPRTRIRFVVAAISAVLALTGWGLLLFGTFLAFGRRY